MSGLLSRKKGSTNAREFLCSNNPTARIVLLGKRGVGKSAITVRLVTRRFIGEYDPNLEMTLKYSAKLNGDEVVAEIMDTARNCDADTLYKWKQWADCFVLVYSVDDIDSLREIVRIKRLMDQVVNCNLKPTFIIANKIDLSTAITVSTTAGIEYANEAGCPHYELSARENFIGIEATFTIIIETAIRCSMLSQINKFYQSPSSKDPAVTQKERKSSFKSIVKTLTRQKAIKEEIKEENGNEQKEIPYVKGYDLLSNSSRRRSSTCTF